MRHKCEEAKNFVVANNIKGLKTVAFSVLLWCTRQDSNLWPSESESDALSNCATGAYKQYKCFQ